MHDGLQYARCQAVKTVKENDVDIGNFRDQAIVIGCRIHDNDADCLGKVKRRVSIYGAEVIVCEKAFNELPEMYWPKKGAKK